MTTNTRRTAAIVLVALLIRLVVAAALGDGFRFADEARYVDAARRLWSGDGFGADYVRVPGYPVLLAVLGGPWQSVRWLRLAQAALAATGAALTVVVADRVAGRTAAICAGTVYALDPLLAFSAGLLYPEAAAAIILLASVLAAIHAARRDSVPWAGAAGVLLGALALFRPVSLALVPLMGAWMAVAAPSRLARRASRAAALVLACLLVLAPWTYRNYQRGGRFVPVSVVGTEGAGVSGEAMERQGVAASLAARALGDPERFATRMTREFAYFWELFPHRLQTDDAQSREALHRADPRLPTTALAPTALRNAVAAAASAAELLLAGLGLIVMWRRSRRETALLAGTILMFALGHALFVGKMRYRITVLPLLFVYAGAGAARLWPRPAERSVRTTD